MVGSQKVLPPNARFGAAVAFARDGDREFPREVMRVLYPRVHPEPSRGREPVRGVAAQERAPATSHELVRDFRGHRPRADASHVDVVERIVFVFVFARRGAPRRRAREPDARLHPEVLLRALRRREVRHLSDELAVAAHVVRDDDGDDGGVKHEV